MALPNTKIYYFSPNHIAASKYTHAVSKFLAHLLYILVNIVHIIFLHILHLSLENSPTKAGMPFSSLLQCFLKEIENMYSVFLSNYTNTCESLGELKKAVETLTSLACVPTAFLILSNFHLCLYNSIETRYMFSIS